MAIKITREELRSVLADYFPEEDNDLFDDIYDELEEEATQMPGDVFLFEKLLALVRRRDLHHKNISLGQSYTQAFIKNIIDGVNEFCEVNQLPKREGYLEYIRAAIALLGKKKFSIRVLQYKAEDILEAYEDKQIIKGDPNTKVTTEAIDTYKRLVATKTGVVYNPTRTDRVHFVRAAEVAVEMNVSGSTLVEAVFDMLAWKNAIPAPAALYSEKLTNRVADYASKNDLVTSNQTLVLDLKKIKDCIDD